MKTKLVPTLFALVTTFGAIGAAAAQPGYGNSVDRRNDQPPVAVDPRDDRGDLRNDRGDRNDPAPITVDHHGDQAPAGGDHRGVMPMRPNLRRELITTAQAPRRRGTLTLSLDGAGSFDRLALVGSGSNLDIQSVDLVYRRGHVERLDAAQGSLLSIDATRGLQSIIVHYSNHGGFRGSMIKLFGVK